MRDANGFVEWLEGKLEWNGWNHSELGRRSGLSRAAVSSVMAGKHQPGFEFCTGVAKAFDEPPEKVLRLAGLLPARELDEEQVEEILFYLDKMTTEQQEYFRRIGRALAEG